MLDDSEYIKLEGIDDKEMSLRLSLLGSRSSRRVSDNSTGESSLQQSINDMVERNPCKRIGLHQACRDGLAFVAERLIQANPSACNEYDQDGLAPLHHAARGNFVEIIKLLLNAGADINVIGTKSCTGMTPLICASKFDSYEACRVLIQNGANITKKTCNGQSPVHYAARKGHTRVLEILLNEGGISVNVEDNDKATPLHTAAQAGQTEVIRKLVLYGGDMALRDNDGYTPLHLAARDGHVDAFKEMLRKAKYGGLSTRTLLNSPDNYGNVCLHLAIKHGHKEIVELCLESGADIGKAQEDFSTPIHLACSQGNVKIAKLLVNNGAKIESEDGNGLTPLLRASLEGHVPIIEYLIEQGAQLCPTTENLCTVCPLMCAVKRSQYDAAKYFLALGFPLKCKDLNWRTVLHVAVSCADIQTVDLILENGGHSLLEIKDQYGKTAIHYAAARCNVEIVNRLILVGADVRAKDNDERIPLHLAAEAGVVCVVRYLLSACPESVNDLDYGSRTPLHYAAAKGWVEVATHLLQNGAEVDYRDDERHTPLFHAAIHGCPVTTDALLHYGADINSLDKNRKTPLILAAYLGHLKTFRKLVKCGADATIVSTTGYNCLDATIRGGHLDVCMEIVKHEKWREILKNTKCEGVSAMRRLVERFPQVAKLVLDKCIEPSAHLDTDPNYSITYDFSLLYPKPGEDLDCNQKKYCGLKSMLDCGREDLLFHPLTRELVRMKWRRVGLTVFFLGAILYALFLTTFSLYLYCGHYFMPNNSSLVNEQVQSYRTNKLCRDSWLYPQEILLILFCCFNLLLEAYQIYSERWAYFDLTNFLEVSTYVTTLATLLPANGTIDASQWPFGIIALLLAFVAMLLQLQLLICSGIYVTMLAEVLKSVFKVIVVFSMLVIAYGLIFFLLLGDELSYTSPYMSILKVFDMMAGGVEFNHYFVEKDLAMPELARFVCFTFILVMSISFMNLLIGLAVGDIEAVRKNAELKRLKTQIEAMSQFEEKLPLRIRERLYLPKLVLWPNSGSTSFIRKLTWYLGLSDSCPIQIIEKTPSDEDKITQLQEQLGTHHESIMAIQAELQSQRTILENISLHLGARSPVSTRTNLLDDF